MLVRGAEDGVVREEFGDEHADAREHGPSTVNQFSRAIAFDIALRTERQRIPSNITRKRTGEVRRDDIRRLGNERRRQKLFASFAVEISLTETSFAYRTRYDHCSASVGPKRDRTFVGRVHLHGANGDLFSLR